jgi:hypothetical protein
LGRNTLRLTIGILVSLLFLWLVFRGANLGETLAVIKGARYGYLLPALVVYMLGVTVRVYRWQVLLAPIKKISVKSLFPMLVIGYMANNILPFRLGEVYRAYCLGRQEKVSRSASLGTIVVERIFDGVTMVVFLIATSLFFVASVPDGEKPYLIAAELFFILALVAAFAFALKGDAFVRLMDRIARLLPESRRPLVTHISRSFTDGFGVIRQGRAFATVALLSLLSWSIEAVSYYITAQAFGLAIPIWTYWFVLALSNLGGMIPAAPGSAGTFDKPGQLGLILFGVSRSSATAFILVLHYAILYLPLTLMGLFFAWRFNIKLALNPGETGDD